jgi:hypothetical protein
VALANVLADLTPVDAGGAAPGGPLGLLLCFPSLKASITIYRNQYFFVTFSRKVRDAGFRVIWQPEINEWRE